MQLAECWLQISAIFPGHYRDSDNRGAVIGLAGFKSQEPG
jgi:hypothetical protein